MLQLSGDVQIEVPRITDDRQHPSTYSLGFSDFLISEEEGPPPATGLLRCYASPDRSTAYAKTRHCKLCGFWEYLYSVSKNIKDIGYRRK